MRSLYDIGVGEIGVVNSLLCKGLIKERMLALGITKGANIEAIRNGPRDNLKLFDVRGVMLALRKEESLQIIID